MNKDLPIAHWSLIQSSVPVFCVDVIPMRIAASGDLELGLILRATPEQGDRWCIIGGRLLLDETIECAVKRELTAALGTSLRATAHRNPPPLLVEYSRSQRRDALWDPRQHAISATHLLWMSGSGKAQGSEARRFRWWNMRDLTEEVMGFGQESLIAQVSESATASLHL